MIRSNPIYISVEVYRWLRLLSKAEGNPGEILPYGEHPKIATADAIADQILRQAIREQHPTLMEHQKKIDKLEKDLIEELRNEKLALPRSGS